MKRVLASTLLASAAAFAPAAFKPRTEVKLFGEGEYGASSTSF